MRGGGGEGVASDVDFKNNILLHENYKGKKSNFTIMVKS